MRQAQNWSRSALKQGVAFVLFGMLAVHGANAAVQLTTQPAQQGGGLKFLNPSSGGQVIYGPLENQKSQGDGMVFMLQQVGGHFGDKPKVGKVIAAKDGSSLAVFFTVTDNMQSHQPLSGLVLIQSHGKAMDAAVAVDLAQRFGTSEPGMLKALDAAWQPAGSSSNQSSMQSGMQQGAQSSGAPSSGASRPSAGSSNYAMQKLYRATGGDRSIAIDLPPDWEIKGLGGGSIVVEGPHMEQIAIVIWQGMANLIGGDQFSSYTRIASAVRQRNGRGPGTYKLLGIQRLPADQGSAAPIMAEFLVDFHDGHGPMHGNARIAVARAGGALFVTHSYMPAADYDAENPMINRMMHSIKQDVGVISAEGARDMERIRQQAKQNDLATQAQNQRSSNQAGQYEQHRQDLNTASGQNQQHMKDINVGGADFQNYILDRSVVQSKETGGASTTSNNFADMLVKAAPDKFQITTNRQLQAAGY